MKFVDISLTNMCMICMLISKNPEKGTKEDQNNWKGMYHKLEVLTSLRC